MPPPTGYVCKTCGKFIPSTKYSTLKGAADIELQTLMAKHSRDHGHMYPIAEPIGFGRSALPIQVRDNRTVHVPKEYLQIGCAVCLLKK